LEAGEQNLGNKRRGAATGPTGQLGGTGPDQARGAAELTEQPDATAGEAATELTGLQCETVTEVTGQLDLTEPGKGPTGRLGGTGPNQTRGAAELTEQLDVTAGDRSSNGTTGLNRQKTKRRQVSKIKTWTRQERTTRKTIRLINRFSNISNSKTRRRSGHRT